MGYGNWSASAFSNYTTSVGRKYDASTGTVVGDYAVQDMFKSQDIDPALNPHKVKRECRDSEDHPTTIPVILALDVTGSMGDGAMKVAKALNQIMTTIYDTTKDVEFMIMGIGDLAYDDAPIQASQFESDIRIAEQLDKIYFEGGGGGNGYESYTAAWYFGLHNCDLDCWKRGQKGIIITMGDEPMNPYLPAKRLAQALGANVEADVETQALYKEAIEKFDVYHLAIDDRSTSFNYYKDKIFATWGLLGDNFRVVTLKNLPEVIAGIVNGRGENFEVCGAPINPSYDANGYISW